MSSKYKNVKPVINTGFNTRCAKEELLALSKEFRIKPSEAFKRIGVHALALLMLEVAELEEMEQEEVGVARMATSAPDVGALLMASKEDEIPSVASLMRGMDGPLTGREKPTVDETWSRPYLLLDVRDADAFCRESICTAKNYPMSRLSRVNWEAPFLRHYKNKRECLIVLLDDDELLASRAATVLVERGYDNVYLLSGGLNLAKKRFRFGGVVVRAEDAGEESRKAEKFDGGDGCGSDLLGPAQSVAKEFGSLRRPGALERLRRDTSGLTLENVIGKGLSQSEGKLTAATQTDKDG